MNSKIYFLIYISHDKKLIWNTFTIHTKKPWKKFGQNYKPRHLNFLNCLCDASTSQKSAVSTLGNVSTRRSWFTYGLADRAELDQGRGLRAKCKSLSKTTWKHDERRQNNSDKNAFQRFASSFVSFLRRKHDFRLRISTFVWRILFKKNLEFEPLREFQPESSRFEVRDRSSWLSCCKNTSGWRPWYQERLVLKFPIILRWTAKHINIVIPPPLS